MVWRILPKHIADTVCQKRSRLAHLYGLPKRHKERLVMRQILSAMGTFNYTLAKWLDEKLKPLSVNNCTISDVFQFAEEIHELQFNFGIIQHIGIVHEHAPGRNNPDSCKQGLYSELV